MSMEFTQNLLYSRVRRMNSIRNRAEEIILTELVYA